MVGLDVSMVRLAIVGEVGGRRRKNTGPDWSAALSYVKVVQRSSRWQLLPAATLAFLIGGTIRQFL